jgi:transposase
MDNVWFHYSDSVQQIVVQFRVECLFLPLSNTEQNPIEKLFSSIKSNLYSFRPSAISKVNLLYNIERSISIFPNGLSEYYRSFRVKVSVILKRQ